MNYVTNDQAYGFFSKVSEDFDDINGKIPSNASSGNKMVTASDIATKADLVNGLVPANQLPSFVDDVLMGTAQNITETAAGTYSADGFIRSGESTPTTLEDGKTYVDTATNIQFRYTGTGSNLVSMGSNLALGETATTAYAGNKGKANADAISDIQDLIPSGASTSNKLATASDIPDTSGLQPKNLSTTIGSYTTVEGALSGINDGKVDKETGKGLSTNDYDATAKGIVDGIPLTIQQLQGSLLNKVDKEVGKGLSTNDFTDNDKTALQTTIPLEISQLQGSLLNKVDKVNGKGLSTNDYDATAKGKVDGMDASIAASQNGSTALTKATVGWTGKNKLKIPASVVTQEKNGITFTVNRDTNGEVTSIVADGTASARATLEIYYGHIPAGNYIMSKGYATSSGTHMGLIAEAYNNFTWVKGIVSSYSQDQVVLGVDYNGYDSVRISLVVEKDDVLSNLAAYPMIRPAAITDSTYEPHHESVEEWGFPRSEQRVLGAWNILPYPEGFRAVIASNGTISADEGMYCSNYLRIESELFFSFTSKTNECYIHAAYYDSSYNFISRPVIDFAGNTFTKLTIPSNAKYVRFCFEDDAQSVTEPMVCISSSDLSYISHAKSNKQLTELIAPKESAVSTEKTVGYNQNFLIKSGNVVQLILLIRELTATENEVIATIPLGYRPKKDLRFTNLNSPSQFFLANTSGEIRSMQAISTSTFASLYTTWITS